MNFFFQNRKPVVGNRKSLREEKVDAEKMIKQHEDMFLSFLIEIFYITYLLKLSSFSNKKAHDKK